MSYSLFDEHHRHAVCDPHSRASGLSDMIIGGQDGLVNVLGVIKARLTIGGPTHSGLEMALIGALSAMVGYAVGVILKIPAAP